MAGKLFLVATPIGNLDDITLRAIDVLRSVDVIACEDTRHSAKLLNHLGIKNRLLSYHEHNEVERSDELGEQLKDGRSVAVISDAGTPGISDPSFRIVQKAVEVGADVISIPGAVAYVNAAIVSGLPTDSIFFGGFLPSRKSERRRRLAEVAMIPATLAFYESPHRIGAALRDALEVLGDRPAAIARELTKIHEQIHRANLSTLLSEFSATTKGELVLLIDRARDNIAAIAATSSIASRVAELEAEGMSAKDALKQTAREFGVSKSEAYRQVQSEKK